MRLLVVPCYSNTVNLSGCSAYNLSTKFIRSVLDTHEDVFIYRMLPSFDDGVWNNNIVPFEHPRLRQFHTPMLKSQYVEVGMVTKEIYELFNQVIGKYHIDAILCERPAAAMILKKTVQHYFDERSVEVPVFLREPFVKTMEMHGVSQIEEMSQTFGYLASNVIIYSEHDKSQLLKVSRKYLNPSAIKVLLDRVRVIASGTDCDEFDKVKAVAVKREKFTVAVCERLTAQQQGDALTTIMDYVYSSGRDIGFMISSQSGGGKFNKRIEDWAEIYLKNSRENYLKLMPTCHAFVSCSVHHSYAQALMEQLYCGLVGVLPAETWFTSIMPDYPFMYKPGDFIAAGTLIRWIQDNYEEAKQRVEWVPAYIRKNYDVKKKSLDMFDWMRAEVERASKEAKVANGFVEVFKDLDLKDGFSLDDALDWFKSKSKYKIELREDKGGFSTSKSLIVELLHRMGYVDKCDDEVPRFYKK